MHPRHIRAHADHTLAHLREGTPRDRLAPLGAGVRRSLAARLRAWAIRIDRRGARAGAVPEVA